MKPVKSIVLLVNLGSPNFLSTAAIRNFLGKFLTDRRVVDLPKLAWYPILYGIILPLRARRLLKQYRQIWLKDESPLIYYTQQQKNQLANLLGKEVGVEHAFCYASPDIPTILHKIHVQYDVTNLLVIPLYPQFSSTTTSPVFDQIAKFYATKKYLPTVNFIRSFYTHPQYIEAIANQIKASWHQNGRADKLVFSYHSLPEVIINQGDAYLDECLATTQLIALQLGLSQADYQVAFQSRFGAQKWLTPATVTVIAELAKSGVKSVDIICPGFVSDCLETLEEIAIINRQIFEQHGGSGYNYIPCLNEDKLLIKLLKSIVTAYFDKD